VREKLRVTGGVSEQGAEENMWAEEGCFDSLEVFA
jgi:hypothetical protein